MKNRKVPWLEQCPPTVRGLPNMVSRTTPHISAGDLAAHHCEICVHCAALLLRCRCGLISGGDVWLSYSARLRSIHTINEKPCLPYRLKSSTILPHGVEKTMGVILSSKDKTFEGLLGFNGINPHCPRALQCDRSTNATLYRR